MKCRKRFQWRMAALMTGVAMTCVMMMTSCSVSDNPVGGDDLPGGTFGGNFKSLNDVAVGDYVFDDGTISTTSIYMKDGISKYPIGVVVYVGQDAISENGVMLRDGKTTLQSHCLVLSLKSAEGGDVFWANNSFAVELGDDNLVKSTAALKRTTDVSGYTNTKTLVEKAVENGAPNLYPAAAAAWNYDYPTPAGSTGWFLPSAQQWAHIIAGANSLGQLDFNKVVWNDWIYEFANPGFLHKLNAAATYEVLDGWNWTSSEYDWRNAVAIYFGYVDNVSSAGFKYNHKGEAKYIVRPIFAM